MGIITTVPTDEGPEVPPRPPNKSGNCQMSTAHAHDTPLHGSRALSLLVSISESTTPRRSGSP